MPTPAATAAPTTVQTSSETDREALIVLYNATGGPDWRYSDHWLSDVPISQWYGVTTDDNGRVTELELDINQLSGEMPPELGNLGSLSLLYLNENQLSGQIPSELGSLANLTRLGLDGNQLSGCVPSSLSGRLDMDESDLVLSQPPNNNYPNRLAEGRSKAIGSTLRFQTLPIPRLTEY